MTSDLRSAPIITLSLASSNSAWVTMRLLRPAAAGAAMTADRVDFVDEDDAGRILLGLLEHVADPAGADADKHFDEVRAGNGEERHIGFAGDRARDQRLAGAGRSDQEHAARN